MRKSFIYSLIVLFGLLFIGCGSDDSAKAIEKKDNVKIENSKKYTLITTKGEKLNIELVNNLLLSNELNGKIVLLNFWATWCPPCKKEMPAFVKLQEKYKDRFVVVGVLMEKDKNPKELQEFLDQYKINFPITVSDENFRFAKDIGNVQRFPESFLFSKEGMFYKKFIGEVDQLVLESYIIEE